MPNSDFYTPAHMQDSFAECSQSEFPQGAGWEIKGLFVVPRPSSAPRKSLEEQLEALAVPQVDSSSFVPSFEEDEGVSTAEDAAIVEASSSRANEYEEKSLLQEEVAYYDAAPSAVDTQEVPAFENPLFPDVANASDSTQDLSEMVDLEEPEVLQSTESPQKSVKNPVILFASARGGVGKSAVSALVASAAALLDLRVALVDLDLSFGNLYGFFGLSRPADMTGLADGVDAANLQSLAQTLAQNLDLYGPCDKPEYAELLQARVQDIIAELSHRYDFVFVDASTNWTEATASVAQIAHKTCLVSDCRAGALSSLARAAGLLVRLGVARTKILRLINRADPKERDEEFVSRETPGLESARTLKTYEGGIEVAEYLSAGEARALLMLDNAFSKSCQELCVELLRETGIILHEERIAEAFGHAAHKKRGGLLKMAQAAFLKEAV